MNLRKILVIMSRKSGAGTDIRPEIEPIFKKHGSKAKFVNVATPVQAVHKIEIHAEQFDLVIIYGGDGTVVEAIKALSDTRVPLLIIPGGTGNLTAKFLGLPSSAARVLNSLYQGKYSTAYFDVAQAGKSLLGLDIHIGWWAESTLSTPRSLKKRIGMLAYGYEALKKLPAQKRDYYRYRLDDGRVRETYAYTSLFANKAIQNFFGFKLFNKPERPGTLEIAFVTSLNPLRFLMWILGRFATGRNLGGFIKTHYAYKVELLQAPKTVLFDDFEKELIFPYELRAGYGQTKIIVPHILPKRHPLNRFLKLAKHFCYVVAEQIRNTIAGAPVYRYAQVMPYLYVGGSFRRKAVKEFTSWGISAIVNMRRTPDVDLGPAFDTLHLPTTDLHAPSIESLHKGVRFIHKNITERRGVYLHCRHGRGRGPTMTAAYLIQIYGMTTEQAIEYLEMVRPMTEILRPQRKRLKEFEQLISMKK